MAKVCLGRCGTLTKHEEARAILDSITVRRMPFEFDGDIDPLIVPGNPEQSFAMVAGSLLLPHLEPYLIRSMKAAEMARRWKNRHRR